MVSAMTIQKKPCCVKQHGIIDTIWEPANLICGICAVGGNYNLTHDTPAGKAVYHSTDLHIFRLEYFGDSPRSCDSTDSFQVMKTNIREVTEQFEKTEIVS